jgi:hypothetical protein
VAPTIEIRFLYPNAPPQLARRVFYLRCQRNSCRIATPFDGLSFVRMRANCEDCRGPPRGSILELRGRFPAALHCGPLFRSLKSRREARQRREMVCVPMLLALAGIFFALSMSPDDNRICPLFLCRHSSAGNGEWMLPTGCRAFSLRWW